jgi:hypothetical protein
MKIVLVLTIIIFVLFIAFQIYATMSVNKTETQAYKVIRTEGNFEIRHYPSATMAMITSSAKTYKELGSSGFAKLASYIFGGNKDKMKIAMTSPVHMDIGDSVSSMSFVMPSNYNKDNLPRPDNSDIAIKTTPDEYVASIQFGGFTSDENIKKYTEMLESSLKEHHLSYYGNFRYLGYNPPYQLIGRKNEIIVSLNWDSK